MIPPRKAALGYGRNCNLEEHQLDRKNLREKTEEPWYESFGENGNLSKSKAYAIRMVL
jgi:hypothetical protein